MQDLTLVGMHEDGEHLVLTDAAGERFRVPVDESLRAAVSRDRPRPRPLQVDADGLRPREIQARIRAGQTAEEVAEAAGVPLEHIRRFEGPVLAEREFVATQARGVRLRRSGTTITSYTLGELVLQRLGQREVDDARTEWDAWREDDGTWVVCLSFHASSTHRRAHWTYDTQLRHVSARDDEARWFTEEERTEISSSGQRRLTPIRDAHDVIVGRDSGRDLAAGREPLRTDPDPRGARDRAAAEEPRYADPRYLEQRHTEQRHTEQRHTEQRHGDAHQGEGRTAEHGAERYESARYGEDRFREDPQRDETYDEDRPAEVRRATIDLLDTLRERRGRRQHLAPADPVAGAGDAVDVAVETLRTRADGRGEGTGPGAGPRSGRRRDVADDQDLLPLPDDVIELPDEEEPARRRPAVTPAAPARERSASAERAPAAGRASSPTHPAGGARRPADRGTDRGERARGRTAEPAAKATPTRGGGSRSAMPAPSAPVAGSPSGGRGSGGSGSGRRAPIGGYPSPAAPPAPPAAPAPARERQDTGPVDEPGAGERGASPSRRNKRASVPSWDDIVFGSRRE